MCVCVGTKAPPSAEMIKANDLGIFQKINKKGMSVENFRSAISSQLSEVSLKDWSEESKNPAVVNKILVGLKKSL